MTSLHRRPSAKVAIPIEDDRGRGGVAACMNWTRPTQVSQESGLLKVSDQITRAKANEVLRDLGNSCLRSHMESYPNEARLRSTTPLSLDRPLTPAVCAQLTDRSSVVPLSDREQALFSQLPAAQQKELAEPQPEYTHRHRSQDPFQSTKEYFEKYLNCKLSESDIQSILSKTHNKLISDIEKSATEEQLKQRYSNLKRPPGKYQHHNSKSSESRYDRLIPSRYEHQGYTTPDVTYIPRPPFTEEGPGPRQTTTIRRPAMAFPHTQPGATAKRVTWDVTPRDSVQDKHKLYLKNQTYGHPRYWRKDHAAPLPSTIPCVTSEDDDMYYQSAKYEQSYRKQIPRSSPIPTQLYLDDQGTSRGYRVSPSTRARSSHKRLAWTSSGDKGTVNVQLDCPENSSMTVNVRLQSRSGSTH